MSAAPSLTPYEDFARRGIAHDRADMERKAASGDLSGRATIDVGFAIPVFIAQCMDRGIETEKVLQALVTGLALGITNGVCLLQAERASTADNIVVSLRERVQRMFVIAEGIMAEGKALVMEDLPAQGGSA